jgi:hypothetical protein
LSDQELANKFEELASSVLNEPKMKRLMNLILTLEKIANVGQLAELLY